LTPPFSGVIGSGRWCLGPVPDFPPRPQLEIDEWTVGRPLSGFVSENGWAAPAPA
jgi:5,6-dimethylbenzimidazole synthase